LKEKYTRAWKEGVISNCSFSGGEFLTEKGPGGNAIHQEEEETERQGEGGKEKLREKMCCTNESGGEP